MALSCFELTGLGRGARRRVESSAVGRQQYLLWRCTNTLADTSKPRRNNCLLAAVNALGY